MILDIYSDKNDLGTIFTSLEDAQAYMLNHMKERIRFNNGDLLNNMPTICEISKKVGRSTFKLWLVAHS
jgi:hypothetical protein